MGLYSGFIQGQALTASATKTLLQLLTGANDRAKIVEWSVSFDGSAAAQAIRVDLLRQTSTGTMSAFTEVAWDAADGAPAGALTTNATAEPAAGDILFSGYVSPNTGMIYIQYPLGREPVLAFSTRMGIRVITPTGVSPNATAHIVWEE